MPDTTKRAAPATADKLRFSIDREGQGDKVDFPDPAAAPLGTDDEASGNPPTRQELDLETVGHAPAARASWIGPVLYALVALVVFLAFLALVLAAMN